MYIRRPLCSRASPGFSLIEVIIFIVIVGVGIAGILSVLNVNAQHSWDPAMRKQMLAIAESLLEEVELMPFTYCDPDDANVLTATSATVGAGASNCATWAEGTTATAGETRFSATLPYDNVGDYGGATGTLSLASLTDVTQTAFSGLSGYSATINVAQSTLGSIVTAGAVLQINVTVTSPRGDSLALTGYRTRYAPNSP
jgi:MSHA pilin protein MshD